MNCVKKHMKNTIKIKFEKVTLEWKIGKDSASQNWAEAVDTMVKKLLPDRLHYSNFYKNNKEQYYLKMINAMTELKNNIADMPEVTDLEKITLPYLNDLHSWFAKNKSTHELLAEMHHYLHSLESISMYEGYKLPPTLQVSWTNTIRIPFSLEEYNNFTDVETFGNILLTYCHIGKDPIAIYRSNDKLSDDVFVPWTHFSSDFIIHFGNNRTHNSDEKFWSWFDENYQWFKERTDWERRDIQVVTGRYVVGKLLTDISKEEILDLIKPESAILEIILE